MRGWLVRHPFTSQEEVIHPQRRLTAWCRTRDLQKFAVSLARGYAPPVRLDLWSGTHLGVCQNCVRNARLAFRLRSTLSSIGLHGKWQVGSLGLTTAARRRCCPRSQPVAIACPRLGLLPSMWVGKFAPGSPSRRFHTLAFCQSRADGNCHGSGNSVGYCQGKNKLHSFLLPLSLSLYPFNLPPKKGAKCPSVGLLPPPLYRTLHGIIAEALGTTPNETRQQDIGGDSHEHRKTRKQVYWCTIGTGRSPRNDEVSYRLAH